MNSGVFMSLMSQLGNPHGPSKNDRFWNSW
jgi:hypothetical protein